MPLGAFRINTLGKVQEEAGVDYGPRTSSEVTVALTGNAQISTAQNKFGGSSVVLDGNNDAVDPDHTVLNIGSGDFTIEWFYYPTDFTTVYGRYFFDTGSGFSGRLNGYFNASNQFVIRSGNSVLLQASHGMSTGQWYHLAIVRESGTLRFFRDGTSLASVSNSTNFTNNDYRIGLYLGGSDYGIIGYVDEWRQSDVARYSGSSFTVPTSAFTPDGATKLLLHFDGSNGDTTTQDDAIKSDLPALDTQDSYYLSGTVTSNSSASQDITVSFWFRHPSGMASDAAPIIMYMRNTPFTAYIGMEYQGGRIRVFSKPAAGFAADYTWGTYSASYGSGTYDDGAWHHIVFSRDSSTSTNHSYVDGSSVTRTVNLGREDFTRDMWPANDMSLISILSGHAFNDTRVSDIEFAQLFVDNVYYDLSDSATRAKFYDGGSINMGTDGTASGLAKPLIFHQGNTSTFATAGGDTTTFPYSVTQYGTGADISSANGPQGG